MKKKLLLALSLLTGSPAAVLARTQADQDAVIRDAIMPDLPMVTADQGQIDTGFQTAIIFAGFVSLVFVVIGGYKYIISSGDPQKTQSAKNTILYAVIGLIISISAFTILRITIGAVDSGT